ncbi:zinc ribbon domain-containing protein [Paenibacillus sp. F411]|uniref:zinc ribbon domain-containing protein n=1 Tax=Paenibacillus sp. F411 TaxID=2820239 RepID=UPI001AAF1A91|nr:zinc ribbon domain-containing protein [Paenibacillus sp. F411]MBO2945392.1 zinc ribbon domain-containing protein [Paenibacillus sp. F411]
MNILQRLKDGANKATEKAQHVVEINKLNSRISEIEQQKNSYYTEMGKVFYEGYRSQDMSLAEKEMVSLAKACDELEEQIYSLRGRIAVMKNERLCQCGRTVPLDVNFCPYCGSKQEGRKPSYEVRRTERTQDSVYEDAAEESLYREETAAAERDPDEGYNYRAGKDEKEQAQDQSLEEDDEYSFGTEYEYYGPDEDSYEPEEENVRRQQEEKGRERRHLEELERERERQLELDRRIRFWQENNQSRDAAAAEGLDRDTVKCQICSGDLTKGSKWCPRCGAEQI